MPAQPNVLLIVIDCLRADFVNQKGLAYIPTIDSLRERGFSFVNAISSSTCTTPSFANVLTGRYPFEHGVRAHAGMTLDEKVATLPQLLKQAGYHTYAEVSGPLGIEVRLNRGFDEYNHRHRRTTIHTDWGQTLLDKFERHYEAPWFVLLHIWPLHRPRQVVPERDNKRFGRTEYGRALSSIDLYLERLVKVLPEQTIIVLTGDHGEEISYGYLDFLQKRIRRKIYRSMKKRGYTRTHYSHGLRGCSGGHGYGLYDLLAKVPLIFHCPGRLPAGRSETQVRHIDIAPSILDAAGVEPPSDLTGTSVMDMVRGRTGSHRDVYLEAAGILTANPDDWLAAMRVDNKYKYICAPYDAAFQPELYDLEADPDERASIAQKRPDVASQLRQKIDALRPDRFTGGKMSDEEQRVVLARLKDLGYHD